MYVAKDFRAMARNKLKGHWGTSILVSLVAGILGGLGSGGSSAGGAAGQSSNASGAAPAGASPVDSLVSLAESNPVITGVIITILTFVFVVGIVMFFIGGAVELGHDQYYMELCNDRAPAFKVLFSRFGIFFKALGLRLFVSLFIFLWMLLLIVPGIVAAYRYSMASYIMAQNPDIGIREAVNRSKEMMAGRKWRMFCLDISFIGWALLSVLTCGIGFLWLIPYTSAARAAFYLDASGQGIPAEPQLQA